MDTPQTPAPEVLATPATAERAEIAPVWHTVVLIIVLLAFSFLGAISEHSLSRQHGKVPQYLLTMAWEWLLFGYVWWGIRKRGVTLREIIGGRWNRVEDFLIDLAIAVAFWLVAGLVLGLLGYALGFGDPAKIREARRALEFLVPKTMIESVLWVFVSITAGICEEVIFRGYLQRQVGNIARNAAIGIVVSSACFGAAHGYEGARRMLLIAVFGSMFSLLAYYRRSLRPGMMTHAFHDTASGLLQRFVPTLM